MKFIKSIEIMGYRGLEELASIKFATPNGSLGSGLTVLVGPNGSGKSSVIEAARWCMQPEDPPGYPQDELMGHIILEDSTGNKIKVEADRSRKSPIRRQQGFHLKDFEFTYVSTEGLRLSTVGDHSIFESPDLNRLSTPSSATRGLIVMDALSSEQRRSKLYTLLREFMPNFREIIVQDHGSMIIDLRCVFKSRTDYASGLGIGVGALVYILSHFVIWDDHRPTVVALDEPELYLHPQSQRKLYRLLRDLSTHTQAIVASNSPYFVNWQDFSQGATLVRMNHANDGNLTACQLPSEAKYFSLFSSSTSDWQRPHLFDLAAKEILFAERILFVEGQEDVGLIKKFAADCEIELTFEIFGYGSGGANNIFPLLQLASDMGIKAAALFDRGVGSEMARCRDAFPRFCIEHLPTPDIRDKPEKAVEGIFNSHGKIKPQWVIFLERLLYSLNSHFES